MKHYTYRLYVTTSDGTVVKRFLGNDKNEMIERFEMWVIKSNYDRFELRTSFDYVQHSNNH